jgi:release factor glutamine methyltransferase
MNEKSTPTTPRLKDWLSQAKSQLEAVNIPSASLDAEIILSDALGKNRTYLHAHPEDLINSDQLAKANSNLSLRLKRTPIAYITGSKEFYGRSFEVSAATLIPRPESEDIIESLRQILPSSENQNSNLRLIDVGTGSGCIGITAKLEFPHLSVELSDISKDALKIASKNAEYLSADVTLTNDNLLNNISNQPDIIVANLPYVDKQWERSPETAYEPELALFANDGGMAIIKQLIDQASNHLKSNGYIIIEADPSQHHALTEYAEKIGFQPMNKLGYILSLRLQR